MLVQHHSTQIIQAHHWIIPAQLALCCLTYLLRALPNVVGQVVLWSELSSWASLGTFRTPCPWWLWVPEGLTQVSLERKKPLPLLLSGATKLSLSKSKVASWWSEDQLWPAGTFCMVHRKSWISYQHKKNGRNRTQTSPDTWLLLKLESLAPPGPYDDSQLSCAETVPYIPSTFYHALTPRPSAILGTTPHSPHSCHLKYSF